MRGRLARRYLSSSYVCARRFAPGRAAAADGAPLTARLEATLSQIQAGLETPCAPLSDVTPEELYEDHGGAIRTLLEPLWAFQESVIRDLLARVR